MHQILFAIKDEKVGTFNRPFSANSIVDAIRTLSPVVNSGDANNLLAQYPGDFHLYQVGKFIQETGELIAEIHAIANLQTLKKEV